MGGACLSHLFLTIISPFSTPPAWGSLALTPLPGGHNHGLNTSDGWGTVHRTVGQACLRRDQNPPHAFYH